MVRDVSKELLPSSSDSEDWGSRFLLCKFEFFMAAIVQIVIFCLRLQGRNDIDVSEEHDTSIFNFEVIKTFRKGTCCFHRYGWSGFNNSEKTFCRHYHIWKMEVKCSFETSILLQSWRRRLVSSETSICVYKSTLCYRPEGHSQNYRCFNASCLHLQGWCDFSTEYGVSVFLWDVGISLQNYTMSQPGGPESDVLLTLQEVSLFLSTFLSLKFHLYI